jgi:hypothetical protein
MSCRFLFSSGGSFHQLRLTIGQAVKAIDEAVESGAGSGHLALQTGFLLRGPRGRDALRQDEELLDELNHPTSLPPSSFFLLPSPSRPLQNQHPILMLTIRLN